MKLNEGEKIDSWDVIVRTTEGRELEFMKNLGLTIYDGTAADIDDLIESKYPVTWIDEEIDED